MKGRFKSKTAAATLRHRAVERNRAWRKVINLGVNFSRHKEQSKATTAQFIQQITRAVSAAQQLDEETKRLRKRGK